MMDTSSTCKSSLDLDLTVDSPQKWNRSFSSGPPSTAITDGQARGVEVQRIIEVVRLSTLESVLRAQFTVETSPRCDGPTTRSDDFHSRPTHEDIVIGR